MIGTRQSGAICNRAHSGGAGEGLAVNVDDAIPRFRRTIRTFDSWQMTDDSKKDAVWKRTHNCRESDRGPRRATYCLPRLRFPREARLQLRPVEMSSSIHPIALPGFTLSPDPTTAGATTGPRIGSTSPGDLCITRHRSLAPGEAGRDSPVGTAR